MMRFISRAMMSAIAALAPTLTTAGPLPFQDGQYVVHPDLCFLDEDQLKFTYTDSLGRLLRRIEGTSLTDGYELYCEVSDVRQTGSKVTFKATCEEEGEASVLDGAYTRLSDNAFRLYGETFRRCGSEAAIPQYEDYIDANSGELVELYADANGRCRGGNPSDPKTLAACGEREQYGIMLEDRGWCYGENASSGAESFWAPCMATVRN